MNNYDKNNRMFVVYILSNYSRTTFYIGVTNNLPRRLWEHQHKFNDGFTAKYHVNDLLYYELMESSDAAISREKQIKNWHRQWKINLIKQMNPNLEDLSKTINP